MGKLENKMNCCAHGNVSATIWNDMSFWPLQLQQLLHHKSSSFFLRDDAV
jgi:hypothetical protein